MKVLEVYDVNDTMLSLLRKIRLKQVLSVLNPVLEAKGYHIEQISFVWLKFAKNNLIEQNFRSLKDDDSYAVFGLQLRKENQQRYGVYHPFSGKLYVISCEQVASVKAIFPKETIQFVLKYTSFKSAFSIYTRVRRQSRWFELRQSWLKKELQLCALQDCLVERDVICNEGITLENAFYAESQSENFNSYRAMYFRTIEDE